MITKISTTKARINFKGTDNIDDVDLKKNIRKSFKEYKTGNFRDANDFLKELKNS